MTEKIKNKDFSKPKDLTQDSIMKMLDWAYDQTVNGLPGQKTIYRLADDYLEKYDKKTAIRKLVNNQTTKAAVSGFVTGIGGLITLPVAIPANITTVILFQMRMIGAIATMNGFDLKSDQVQTFVYASLAGSSLNDLIKGTSINIGTKLVNGVIDRIPGVALTKINQRVGFRLLTKFGSKGAINLGKMVPVVGGVFGAGLDIASTRIIAKVAQNTFTEKGIFTGNSGEIIDNQDFKKITGEQK